MNTLSSDLMCVYVVHVLIKHATVIFATPFEVNLILILDVYTDQPTHMANTQTSLMFPNIHTQSIYSVPALGSRGNIFEYQNANVYLYFVNVVLVLLFISRWAWPCVEKVAHVCLDVFVVVLSSLASPTNLYFMILFVSHSN